MICRKLNLELLCLLEHAEYKLYFIPSSLGIVRGTSAFVSIFYLFHSSQLFEHSLFIFFNCTESSEE